MKKSTLPDHNAGIWLDQETAYIVHLAGAEVTEVDVLHAEVESKVRTAGEGKVYTRFGHTFIDNQEKKQHRQQNQRAKFYKEIIGHLQGMDIAYLFGPGQMRHGLHRMMEKDTQLSGHTAACVAAGKMNKEQAVAATIGYFNSAAFRQYRKERRKAINEVR